MSSRCVAYERAPRDLTGTSRTVTAEAGKTIVIVGPASFQLREGRGSILGAELDSVRRVVTRGKQTPIEIHSCSSLQVQLGQGARIEELDGSTIPISWREAASTLAELEEGTAIVIGGADSGKTTLCTFLSNQLVREGRRVAVVDADIGQTDMGPPTTMAAGEFARPVTSFSQVEPSERLFIGLTSPGRVKDKVIQGVRKLVGRHAEPGKLVIVNTDGWVTGSEAVAYKLRMLDELKPNLTLGIGTDDDTHQILQAGNRAGLLAGSPDTIKERTRVDRRELRTLGYQKYIAGSSLKFFRMDRVRLGTALGSERLEIRRLSRSRIEELKGRIVGFLDAEGFLQEIGVLKEIVPSSMTVKIWSRIATGPSRIEIGEVRLTDDGRELAYAAR